MSKVIVLELPGDITMRFNWSPELLMQLVDASCGSFTEEYVDGKYEKSWEPAKTRVYVETGEVSHDFTPNIKPVYVPFSPSTSVLLHNIPLELDNTTVEAPPSTIPVDEEIPF